LPISRCEEPLQAYIELANRVNRGMARYVSCKSSVKKSEEAESAFSVPDSSFFFVESHRVERLSEPFEILRRDVPALVDLL
jgi:hypothetical protein